MLGSVGRPILYFYLDHSVIINSFVLIYGLVILIAAINTRRIERQVNRLIVEQTKTLLGKNPDISIKKVYRKIRIPWEELIKQHSFFPFISGESDLWVRRVSPHAAREVILGNPAKIAHVLTRNKIKIKGIEKEARTFKGYSLRDSEKRGK